jgi:hypothetical protein
MAAGRPSVAHHRRRQGDEVTAKQYHAGLERWRVEEGDYGQPLVFHRHRETEHPAYVIHEDNDRRLVQCADCMQYLELVGTTPAASAD